MNNNDGGPAFPISGWEDMTTNPPTKRLHLNQFSGMSLRDYFAAHSDMPWNAAMETLRMSGVKNPTIQEIIDLVVKTRYRFADAMLAARESK